MSSLYVKYPPIKAISYYANLAAFPSQGSNFAYDESTGNLYYWNGSAWVLVTSGGGTFTPGNLTDTGTDGITVTNGTNAVNGAGTQIAQHVADSTHNGYLSSTDWTTFNSKQSALTLGNLTDTGTDGITVTGGTGAVVGSGTSIAQHVADATHNGYLSSTDWTSFNSKQNSISIGALDAQTANANGLALVSSVLSAQSANATYPGMVNNTTQTFSGVKTFSSPPSSPSSGTVSEIWGAGASGASRATALGYAATASGTDSLAIGYVAMATGAYGLALGVGTTSSGYGGTAVGFGSHADNEGSVAIGFGTYANFNHSIAIGYGATCTTTSQAMIGGQNGAISSLRIGNGDTNTSPVDTTIQSTSGSGSNIAGGGLNLASGAGTGTGVGGTIKFQISPAGASSSTPNSLATVGQVSSTGSWLLGAVSTTPTHSLNTNTTTGAGVGTLTNVPGAAGNPAGYIQILINGVVSYIPYFQ